MRRKLLFLYDRNHSTSKVNISDANVSLVTRAKENSSRGSKWSIDSMDVDHSCEEEEMKFEDEENGSDNKDDE